MLGDYPKFSEGYLVSQSELMQLRNITSRYNDDFDNVRTDYSGRGMFGDVCLGIDLDRRNDFNFIFSDVSKEMSEDFAGALGLRLTWDNMGLGWIAYFPGIKVSADSE
jgi:hypothetical protein